MKRNEILLNIDWDGFVEIIGQFDETYGEGLK